ncbi:PqqD family protein [Streptomyces nojiriensis]|uniref:PqqD family protein n=1 Tax=Streptomyces nojiriensis TaxID=66374 RepID=UPI0035DDE318
MSNLAVQAAPRRVAGVRFRRVGKKLVLIVGNRVYEMNATAETVWMRLDGTTSAQSIAEQIATEYGQDYQRVEADITELLATLATLGAVEA